MSLSVCAINECPDDHLSSDCRVTDLHEITRKRRRAKKREREGEKQRKREWERERERERETKTKGKRASERGREREQRELDLGSGSRVPDLHEAVTRPASGSSVQGLGFRIRLRVGNLGLRV